MLGQVACQHGSVLSPLRLVPENPVSHRDTWETQSPLSPILLAGSWKVVGRYDHTSFACWFLYGRMSPRKALRSYKNQQAEILGRDNPRRALHATQVPSRVISTSFLEPVPLSWSHFMGHHRQKLQESVFDGPGMDRLSPSDPPFCRLVNPY